MNRGFEHRTLTYKLTWPAIWAFVTWVKIRKWLSGAEILPEYSKLLWERSPAIRQMKEGAARWPSLHVIYGWQPTERGLTGLLERYYLGSRACQALRNRRHLVVAALAEAIEKSIAEHGEARVLSLAAGTGQVVFEACSRFISRGDKIKILLVDIDESALATSQELARKYGIPDVQWRCGNALNPKEVAGDFDPTIVEVVGLIDYLEDNSVRRLMKRIQAISVNRGAVITANIHPNPEEAVIHHLLDWIMVYRSRKELEQLMTDSGMSCRFVTEPHGIFTVVVGETQKTSASHSPS